MTNPDLTLIAALLDRSGSMQSSKRATRDGWREFINTQRDKPGKCQVTLAQFDHRYEVVYSECDIATLDSELTLVPRGNTAMLDAIGRFVTEIGQTLAERSEEQRPGLVICLIMTDGWENASREWSWEQVRELITQQRDAYGWQFMFIGANIDAVEVGMKMGIARGQSITYDCDNYDANVGTFAVASAAVDNLRAGNAADFTDEDRRRTMGK